MNKACVLLLVSLLAISGILSSGCIGERRDDLNIELIGAPDDILNEGFYFKAKITDKKGEPVNGCIVQVYLGDVWLTTGKSGPDGTAELVLMGGGTVFYTVEYKEARTMRIDAKIQKLEKTLERLVTVHPNSDADLVLEYSLNRPQYFSFETVKIDIKVKDKEGNSYDEIRVGIFDSEAQAYVYDDSPIKQMDATNIGGVVHFEATLAEYDEPTVIVLRTFAVGRGYLGGFTDVSFTVNP